MLKGFFIVIGVAAFLLVAGGAGAMTYLFSGKSIELSKPDLEVGEPSQPGERDALIASCITVLGKGLGSKAATACGCLADDFEHDLSRVERLMISASFQKDTRRLVAIGMSIAKTGATKEDIDAMKTNMAPTIKSAFSRCIQAN